MDLVELYSRSLHSFVGVIDRLHPDDWQRPTPCVGWSARNLVNHVVYEDRWAVPLLGGSSIADVGDRFEGDLLGDDPHGRALDALKQAEDVVTAPGTLDRTVQLSFGPTPAREYTWQLLAEHLIHSWDLAAAIGADRTLDAETVHACAGWFSGREQLFRDMGAIGPRVDLPADASEQDRLLAAFGRDPHWSAA